MCNNWPDFPIDVDTATGGLIGDTVIICGGAGDDYVDECYSLTSEKATLVTHMSVQRGWSASIVINDNTLWVTGGYGGGYLSGGTYYNGGYLASTEYVTVTGSMPGPDLPFAFGFHAMVAINSTCSMVIGGYSHGIFASTFFYDHNEDEWINGPSLMQERKAHAAGIVTDEVTDEDFVVVTGGNGYLDLLTYGGYDKNPEILQDGEWVQGKINDTI